MEGIGRFGAFMPVKSNESYMYSFKYENGLAGRVKNSLFSESLLNLN